MSRVLRFCFIQTRDRGYEQNLAGDRGSTSELVINVGLKGRRTTIYSPTSNYVEYIGSWERILCLFLLLLMFNLDSGGRGSLQPSRQPNTGI